jgi:hypothetical protein
MQAKAVSRRSPMAVKRGAMIGLSNAAHTIAWSACHTTVCMSSCSCDVSCGGQAGKAYGHAMLGPAHICL